MISFLARRPVWKTEAEVGKSGGWQWASRAALVVGKVVGLCSSECASSSDDAILRSGAAPDPCGPAALIRS